MLNLDPSRGFNMRGIKNPVAFMIKNGINRSRASNLYRGNVAFVKLEHLEKLCSLLRCTPNDLLSWTPDTRTTIDKDHPLQALNREGRAKNLTELTAKLPLEKLSQLESIIQELGNE